MSTSRLLGYLGLAILVCVGWMALNVSTGEALPLLGFTPTPTETPTPATPTDTPPPLTTTPTSTPPPDTTPTPQGTPPVVELTPDGPQYLPETGQAGSPSSWLLVAAVVALFALGIWLPGRSKRV
jgi:hypothetical protein